MAAVSVAVRMSYVLRGKKGRCQIRLLRSEYATRRPAESRKLNMQPVPCGVGSACFQFGLRDFFHAQTHMAGSQSLAGHMHTITDLARPEEAARYLAHYLG